MIGWLALAASAVWLYVPTRRLLKNAPHLSPLTFFSALGLSLGALSILMMWMGLAPIPLLTSGLILAIPTLGVAASLVVAFYQRQHFSRPTLQSLIFNQRTPFFFITALAVLVIAINTISYPFYRYDTITRFAPNALEVFKNQRITSNLTGYPLGMQLLYAFGFMAANGVNDHSAGVYVALTALGLIGTVYLATRLIFSERAAWIATLLALSSPVFIDWATSGYVDVPEGFYHGLTFVFALLWLQKGEWRYALLAGVMAGLGLWIKHSSLVLIPALGVVPLLRVRLPLKFNQLAREAGLGLAALGVCLLLGAPWYMRSYLLGVNVFPAPSTYDELFIDHSLSAFITFWHRREEWGLPLGVTVLLGFGAVAVSLINKEARGEAASPESFRASLILLLAFVIPYHFIWWWQFTYQARYLLVSLPMYAALAGYVCDWVLTRAPFKFPLWAGVLVAGALMLHGVFPRLGAVYHLVRDPFESDEAKLTRLAGAQWRVAKFVRATAPSGAKLFTQDGALYYWLHDYGFLAGYPLRAEDVRGYDYLVVSPWGRSVSESLGQDPTAFYEALADPTRFAKLYAEDVWAVYQIKK